MVKYIVPVPDATQRSGLLASKQAKAGPAGCSRVAAAAALAIMARDLSERRTATNYERLVTRTTFSFFCSGNKLVAPSLYELSMFVV